MTVYYNEIEPYAADWLENLIRAGEIAPGVVDRRSILDVRPSDLAGFTQCHFFAGVGVWSLALRSAGWPDDRPVWTGSCPCQPFSAAGKGGGLDDERHLWPFWHYLIEQCRPEGVFGEQVASKDGLGWLDLVQADMEGTGYALWPVDLCAAGIGAPHIRQRLWIVAKKLEHAAGIRRVERWAEPSEWGVVGRRGVGELDHHHHHQGLERYGRHGVDRGGWPHAARSTSETGAVDLLADDDDERRRRFSEFRFTGLAHQSERRFDDHRRLNAGLLADPIGRNASAEGIQRGWEHGQQQQANSRTDALADAGHRQLPQSIGRQEERDGHGSTRSHDDRSPWGGSPTNGFWRDADWLRCRDGRWRPVEPGTQPLAHGVANRVGRLRAYGNAIVKEAAEAVIRSYLEAEACGFQPLRTVDLVASELTFEDLLG